MCWQEQLKHSKEVDGQMFICADHGNAEQLIDYETGEPFTAHTTNPVPFILVNADPAYKLREGGCLADIAPTLIELNGYGAAKRDDRKIFAGKIMNRDTCKYIAILTMVCNHIARMFLTPGNFLYESLSDIGYFAAMTMCYFLVEGYYYTRSRKNYAGRLLVFAVLSQIPYSMAFRDGQLNMLFTLLLCLAVPELMERPMAEWEHRISLVLIFATSFFCCWKLIAPLGVYLFVRYRGRKKELAKSYVIVAILFMILNFSTYISAHGIFKAACLACGNGLGIALSGIILLCYYNGNQMTKFRKWNRWFFYIFYPVHLLILCLIRYMIK